LAENGVLGSETFNLVSDITVQFGVIATVIQPSSCPIP
jgi:hypothetical protein